MGKRFSNFPISRLQNYKMSFTTADRNNVLRWETEKQMKKAGKNIEKARKAVEQRPYVLADAVPLLQKVKFENLTRRLKSRCVSGSTPSMPIKWCAER